MHRCCFTCWKNNSEAHNRLPINCRRCRSGFPYSEAKGLTNELETSIVTDFDARKRQRTRGLPPRNNDHLNNTFLDPLLAIATGGNHDCQYIHNDVGAGEYTCAYISKHESADMLKKIRNFVYRHLAKLANNQMSPTISGFPVSDKQRLRAIADAVIESEPVGAVQACYILLRLELVTKSRTVSSINPLPLKDTNQKLTTNQQLLANMEPTKNVVERGLTSHEGKRKAYAALVKNQRRLQRRDRCDITLFSLLTSYGIRKATTKESNKIPELKVLLRINETSKLPLRVKICSTTTY